MNSALLLGAFESVTDGRIGEAPACVRQLLLGLADGSDGSHSNAQMQMHPLGFLCIRWLLSAQRTLRLHLWSRSFTWQQIPDWQIHDHVFSFSSCVVAGSLLNKRYISAPVTARPRRLYPIYEVAYDGSESSMVDSGLEMNLRLGAPELIRRGGRYQVARGVLHRTRLVSESAVSLVAASAPDLSIAPRVVGQPGKGVLKYSRSAERVNAQNIARSFLHLVESESPLALEPSRW